VPEFFAVFRYQSDTNTGRAPDFLPLDDVRLGCRNNKALGDVFRIVNTDAWQHDRELVATEAPKDVLRTQTELEAMAEGL
jgi:hypothetical protein